MLPFSSCINLCCQSDPLPDLFWSKKSAWAEEEVDLRRAKLSHAVAVLLQPCWTDFPFRRLSSTSSWQETHCACASMSDFVCRDCGELLTDRNRIKKSMSVKGKQYYLNRCRPCIVDAEAVLRRLKRENPMPPAGTPCACCGRVDKLHCDHDHATKKFRSWICRRCNAGLGLLGDSEAGLRQALEYLERARSRSPKAAPSDKKTDDILPEDNSALGLVRSADIEPGPKVMSTDDVGQGTCALPTR